MDKKNPLLNLLHNGAFVYINSKSKRCPISAINALTQSIGNNPILTLEKTKEKLPVNVVDKLEEDGRFKPSPRYSSSLSTAMHAWITPNEEILGKKFSPSGGFVCRLIMGSYAVALPRLIIFARLSTKVF